MDHIRSIGGLVAYTKHAVKQFNRFLPRMRLCIPGDVDDLKVDHICIKCATLSVYEHLRADFESPRISRYMYQSIVSGRRVAYFRLGAGIPTHHGLINYLELSAPKRHGAKTTTVHHLELYLQSTQNPHDMPTMKDIATVLCKNDGRIQVVHRDRPHHETYDIYLSGAPIIRLSCVAGPLINKIVNEEMGD